MFNFLAYSGARIGEAITLKWKDFNFNENSVHIRRTLYNPNNNKQKYELTSTKNTGAERKLLIDQEQFIQKNKRLYKECTDKGNLPSIGSYNY
ncbi:hypothetical protein DCC39_17480 [Pueribacillus theae]|uniref:Tyr recombinase domain-containing protein n=1 Tax=Pueribacillus theae TaxID=2171751 RepID=A0A2U1JN91_9BACI|nr:hypothetical protein DCC39_17480 [Pueribacillus theae]